MQRVMNKKGFLLILGIILAVFLVIHLMLSANLREKQEQENARRVTLTRMEEENKTLNGELAMVGTEEYIVSSAMSEYAYMNKDDIRFEFTNPEALYAYTEQEMKTMMDELAY